MKRLKVKNDVLGENCMLGFIKLESVSLSARQEEIDWGANAAEFAFNKLLICLPDRYLLLLLLLF